MRKAVVFLMMSTALSLVACDSKNVEVTDEQVESVLQEQGLENTVNGDKVTVSGNTYVISETYQEYKYDPTNDEQGSYKDRVTVDVADATGNKLQVTGASNFLQPTETEGESNRTVVKPRAPGEGKYDNLIDDIKFKVCIRDTGFSKGFALNPHGEFNDSVVLPDYLTATGPNLTEIQFRELDFIEGDALYWKKIIFERIGFFRCYIVKPEGSIPYGSEFKENVGLKDYREILGTGIIMNGGGDYTMSDGFQLISDDKISSKFGDGYYVETYSRDTGMYTGYAVYENNDGRVVYIVATSPYYQSLRDIIMEFADTCVHLY